MITTGGSGGHVFPALSLADKLKQQEQSCGILLVSVKNVYSYFKNKNYNYEIQTISLDRGLPKVCSFKIFIFLIKFIKSFLQAFGIINRFRPDIVVGFGAYASVPVILAAGICNKRIIIHEQNAIPGRANNLVKLFAKKVAISFTGTAKYFDKDKIVLTGNPVRESLLLKIDKAVADERLGLDKDRFTILVMGGSKGAHIINSVTTKAFCKLPVSQKEKLQVIHLTGEDDFSSVYSEYERLNIKNKTFSFYQDMQYAFAAADLIIARAGATTIAEICVLGKPAILVPYPYARSHQLENAKALADKDACVLIEQKDFNEDALIKQILSFLEDKNRLEKLANNCRNLSYPDAKEKLANLVLEEARPVRCLISNGSRTV